MRLNSSTKQKPKHVHTCRKTGRMDVLAEKQSLKIQPYFPFHMLESHFFHIPHIRGEVLTHTAICREIAQQPAKENPSAFWAGLRDSAAFLTASSWAAKFPTIKSLLNSTHHKIKRCLISQAGTNSTSFPRGFKKKNTTNLIRYSFCKDGTQNAAGREQGREREKEREPQYLKQQPGLAVSQPPA